MHAYTHKNHLYIPSYTFFDCHFKAGMYYFQKKYFRKHDVIFEFFENLTFQKFPAIRYTQYLTLLL